MLTKNQELEIIITDLGSEGEGIGHTEDGMTVFVTDALPGDKVLAHITKVKKAYAYAFAAKLLEPSSFRVEAKCAVARKCGGCTFQHMDYKKQLEYKQEKVYNCLTRIGGIENPPMETIVGADCPFFYRNKAQFPVGTDREGKAVVGFYRRHSHDVVANTECTIQAALNEPVLEAVQKFLNDYKIAPYNEETGTGLVRHIFTRTGFTSKEFMVCIVVNGDSLPHSEVLTETLKEVVAKEGYELKSLSLNINKKNTNVIMGDKCAPVYGELYIEDYIGNVKFRISPLSFYQVNPEQTRKLYDLAKEYAGLTGKEVLWDLYCGIGTISLYLASGAKTVYGVEIVPEAIADARVNAGLNGIKNAEFFVGASEDVASELPTPDIIVVDPPRKGCDQKLLDTIVSVKPERVVYVSCDPATLARDLKFLLQNSYELKRVRPVDQFPHTTHVETCVLLSHQQIDKYKTVDYTPDGSYMKNVNRHATYKEINEYVEEKYGFKLHSAFIAQVKRECGIEMGENYNLSKSDDYEPREVTPEKRAAIIDALKHFNMIE